MGLHGMLRGQMVKIIEFKETEKGTKTVLFKVAGRDKNKNSKGEYETDFYLCRAFGNSAEIIEKYFNNVDESGNVVKGKSRKLDLIGHMQSYKSKREEAKPKNLKAKKIFDALGMPSQGKLDGALIPINYTMKIEVTEWIFMVDRVLFADNQHDDDNIHIGSIISDNIDGETKAKTINIDDDDDDESNSKQVTNNEIYGKIESVLNGSQPLSTNNYLK